MQIPAILNVPHCILHNNCAAYRFKILYVPKLRPYKTYVDEFCLQVETDIFKFVKFLLIYQWDKS